MFAPDCGLFFTSKHKNKEWKFVEKLLNILSMTAIDVKEEQFKWHHAILQELEEAQRDPLLGDNDGQEQDPEHASASGVDDEEGQDPELAGARSAENAGGKDDASNNVGS